MTETQNLCGTVLQLQRMSVHDGPGIRTTVFLKGCPLRCAWCHNPESQLPAPEIAYQQSLCMGCGACVKACPSHALSIKDGKVIRQRDICTSCGKCSEICPVFAQKQYGKIMTVEEVCREVLKDKPYYGKDGGVTFSGGEPLMQTDFTVACEQELHRCGISCAVETSCMGSKQSLAKLAENTDYFMVDLKVMDAETHRKWIGGSPETVLSNLRFLSECGADVLVRIPVVTGVNDTPENMRQTARFLLTQTKFRRVELLQMHKLAEGKYLSLGREYPVEHLEIPTEEKMHVLAAELVQNGITTYYKEKKIEL